MTYAQNGKDIKSVALVSLQKDGFNNFRFLDGEELQVDSNLRAKAIGVPYSFSHDGDQIFVCDNDTRQVTLVLPYSPIPEG